MEAKALVDKLRDLIVEKVYKHSITLWARSKLRF